VAHLLIDASASANHSVWVGADPAQISTQREDLDAAARQCPVDEALPAAALAVGAQVVPLENAPLPDGIGALLRHT
ncbi:hypothetical protein, partial [Nocardia farcinica]